MTNFVGKEIIDFVSDNLVVEEVYLPRQKEFLFAVFDGERVSYQDIVFVDGKVFTPLRSELIEKGVVLLPSKTEEYGSVTDLLAEVRRFIHKYYDYSEEQEIIDSYFVLNTWNFKDFSVTPYRRIIGDYGTGKTRFLKVIGSICYRAIFISSVSSEAALYRIIDAYKGTLIIDEADFTNTTMHSTLTKILNSGYQKDMTTIKCRPGSLKPEAFNVFCPKIIASRQKYKDNALESRCITTETQITTRPDIPKSLNSEFYQEAQSLRNKLLLYKLRTLKRYNSVNKEFDSLIIEPRLKEILLPLSSIIENSEDRKKLRIMAIKFQEEIINNRRLGIESIILENIIELKKSDLPLQVGVIAQKTNQSLQPNKEKELSARRCGEIIRKVLRLKTKRALGTISVCMVVIWNQKKIQALCNRYGINFNDLTSLTSKKETTKNPEETNSKFSDIDRANEKEE